MSIVEVEIGKYTAKGSAGQTPGGKYCGSVSYSWEDSGGRHHSSLHFDAEFEREDAAIHAALQRFEDLAKADEVPETPSQLQRKLNG